MSFPCNQCDRSVIENPFECNEYLSTKQKKCDKNLYRIYTINYVNLDDFDKILNLSLFLTCLDFSNFSFTFTTNHKY